MKMIEFYEKYLIIKMPDGKTVKLRSLTDEERNNLLSILYFFLYYNKKKIEKSQYIYLPTRTKRSDSDYRADYFSF